jgi:hypothetical protein
MQQGKKKRELVFYVQRFAVVQAVQKKMMLRAGRIELPTFCASDQEM